MKYLNAARSHAQNQADLTNKKHLDIRFENI